MLNLSAQAVLESPWVVKVKYQDYQNGIQLSNAIADELKWGRTVVLSGHPYSPAGVNIQDLKSHFNFSKAQPVVCLGKSAVCKHRRNLTFFHRCGQAQSPFAKNLDGYGRRTILPRDA